jgi:hypothetical protein
MVYSAAANLQYLSNLIEDIIEIKEAHQSRGAGRGIFIGTINCYRHSFTRQARMSRTGNLPAITPAPCCIYRPSFP